MAEIYLGLTISGATLLPPIRWTGGQSPEMTISRSKQIESAGMLDGSKRYNIRSKHPRKWPLSWEMLTTAQMASFDLLYSYNTALYFQNNWEGPTWRRVVIVDYDPEPVIGLGPTTCRWNLRMTLEEIR
jgi:hypothetical protein